MNLLRIIVFSLLILPSLVLALPIPNLSNVPLCPNSISNADSIYCKLTGMDGNTLTITTGNLAYQCKLSSNVEVVTKEGTSDQDAALDIPANRVYEIVKMGSDIRISCKPQ